MKDNIGGESAFSAKKMSLISKYIESIANLSHDGADSEATRMQAKCEIVILESPYKYKMGSQRHIRF